MDDEIHLKTLKDQLNSLKPVPNFDIDFSDYNSYQFNRTTKNLDLFKEKEVKREIKHPREILPKASTTRDISYMKDIIDRSHYRSVSKIDINEKIKKLGLQALPIGSASSYAKHRRSESVGKLHNQKQIEAQSYPTDIKHLEKLIQFTEPNHRNLAGGRTCQRESCISHNALINGKSPQVHENPDEMSQRKLDEESLMHKLEVWYK